jgi:nitrate reductase NapE component
MEDQEQSKQELSQDEMLKEIYEFTKKTHKYLKWQMYITIVMVVLPVLAIAFILPMVLGNLANTYSSLLK